MRGGLRDGDRIVISPPALASEGMLVDARVVEPEPAAVAAGGGTD